VRLEERWEQAEVERRREWAELEKRFVTAEEKRQVFDDALFLKMNAISNQHLQVLHEISDGLQQLTVEVRILREEVRGGFAEMRAEFAEMRAEQRASREALLQILDRLPPALGAS
jgi:hypothetical protein